LRACNALVRDQLRIAAVFPVRLERPCRTDALPPMPTSPGSHLLVDSAPVGGGLLPELLEGAHPGEPVGAAVVTRATRFDSPDRCEHARSRIVQSQRLAAAEASASAAAWLREERARAEVEATRRCGDRDAIAAQCRARGGDRADVARACPTTEASARCERARERAVGRAFCEAGQHHAERACAQARARVDLLARRSVPAASAAANSAAPDDPPPICRAERAPP
jgi:hypothetical protein